MNNSPANLDDAKKYRTALAKKINRARAISQNELLHKLLPIDPKNILDTAKNTEQYADAKKLVQANNKEKNTPLSKTKNSLKDKLLEVFNHSIKFIEKGKTYYMEAIQDSESITDKAEANKELPLQTDRYENYKNKKYRKIMGDIFLTNEYGVVLGKWNYNHDVLSYDPFLCLQGIAPDGIISKINKMLGVSTK